MPEPVGVTSPDLRHHRRPRVGRGTGTPNTPEIPAEELWQRFWTARDLDARNDLVLHYEYLVHVVIAKLSAAIRSQWNNDDLRSYGMLGLIEAIGRFEPGSSPDRFAAYATARIRGAVFDELRGLDWLPRTVRRRVITYRSAVDSLSGELQRTPESHEVLNAMGVSGRVASDVLREVHGSQLTHLESTQAFDDLEPRVREFIPTSEDPEQRLLDAEELDELRNALASLPERQRTVLTLHLLGGLTQEQVGEMLGVTHSRVCQIEATALAALRRSLKARSRS